MSLTIFWHRRDLRVSDNRGLLHALQSGGSVQPLFIFDQDILDKLNNPLDRRVEFLYRTVRALKAQYQKLGSDLQIYYGRPEDVFKKLISEQKVKAIFTNHDYEPYAINRDQKISLLARQNGVEFYSFKDQVIFEKSEILSDSKKPYTVYTPYKKKWLATLKPQDLEILRTDLHFGALARGKSVSHPPSLQEMGFTPQPQLEFPGTEVSKKLLLEYKEKRDFPALNATSLLGLHLRFGTVSVRELAKLAQPLSEVWLSELIWREFFMQILFHFPHVEKSSFRPDFENVQWRKSKEDFEKWKLGMTGYPLVDAGMRELNQTGHMHNRVRMIVASFLTKHLLIHWLEGERYFASQLLDFELASNNGNWQWAAGTGCDAAPYFRVFNPTTQIERFDPELKYIKKWVPEVGTPEYPQAMVEHKFARERALAAFSKALKTTGKEEEQE
jgi:deoxyribodipyrimidine photo-lyase